MQTTEPTYSLFLGHELLSRGAIEPLLNSLRTAMSMAPMARLAVYDNQSGVRLDLDLSGTPDEAYARLEHHPVLGKPKGKGPGRPKLGVVGREVSLLPRHWDWLAAQPGGASAALRRLVDRARKEDQPAGARRAAIEAAHRFLWDQGGDLPGFEEATRALFAGDWTALEARMRPWPEPIADQVRFMLGAHMTRPA
ncbi:MAG: DUF2239 family protein [Planctomycetota bacterium]